MTGSEYTYAVFVDDNFSLPPDEERYKLGDFTSLDEAIEACKGMVDAFLKNETSLDSPAAERYEQYTHFGPDPFIVTDDPEAGHPPFSSWSYAANQCGQK
ncbi:MAG: hypothetical protein WBM14_19320 [Terracidiphilus sp.]